MISRQPGTDRRASIGAVRVGDRRQQAFATEAGVERDSGRVGQCRADVHGRDRMVEHGSAQRPVGRVQQHGDVRRAFPQRLLVPVQLLAQVKAVIAPHAPRSCRRRADYWPARRAPCRRGRRRSSSPLGRPAPPLPTDPPPGAGRACGFGPGRARRAVGRRGRPGGTRVRPLLRSGADRSISAGLATRHGCSPGRSRGTMVATRGATSWRRTHVAGDAVGTFVG